MNGNIWKILNIVTLAFFKFFSKIHDFRRIKKHISHENIYNSSFGKIPKHIISFVNIFTIVYAGVSIITHSFILLIVNKLTL